jgi:hypothetical protein
LTRAPIQLIDIYRGPHFTALTYCPTAAPELNLVHWPTGGAGLLRVGINTPDSESERIDRSLLDTNGDFRKNYGIDKEAVLLVRPDGHIVSIATQGMCTAITSAMVALTPPPLASA